MKTQLTTASLLALLMSTVSTAALQQAVAPVQQLPAPQRPTNGTKPPVTVPESIPTPPDYVIGPDDTLILVFWREKEMSSEVVVRPDGKISLPLLNDVQAAGLTPDQLRLQLTEAAAKFIEEPTVTVVVKQINSRKVFLTGNVAKPGVYALSAPTTVLQLLATAGGVLEFAKSKDIRIMRTENGRAVSYKFNYREVIVGKNLKQDIHLKPGDTVIVP